MILGGFVLAIQPWVWGVLAVAGITFMVAMFVFSQFLSVWLQAQLSGVRVRMTQLMSMRWRKIDPKKIVFALIRAHKAGLNVPIDVLESHYQAGGNVNNVVSAMIAAQRAGIELTWDHATAVDLTGVEILIGLPGVVRASLRPHGLVKVRGQILDAVSEDGEIDQHTPVVVTDMQGDLLMVRPA